jgi:SAM-dependent methyltransferase
MGTEFIMDVLPKSYFYFKNIVKNMLMLICPNLIIRIKQPTGTGNHHIDSDLETSINYSRDVFQKYLYFLDLIDFPSFLHGKTVCELGPGDTVTVALLFLAYGAARVICFDRFPLVQDKQKNKLIAKRLLEILPEERKAYLQKVISFDARGNITWDNSCLCYLQNKKETIAIKEGTVDLMVSNAVLEHVSDLEGLFREMSRTMKPGALMVHAADLGPHQLNFNTPLDFLAIPEWRWKLMTSYRGAPNRARKSRYELLLKNYCFEILKFEVTERFTQTDIDMITTSVPLLREAMSMDDLFCRSILFSARKLERCVNARNI